MGACRVCAAPLPHKAGRGRPLEYCALHKLPIREADAARKRATERHAQIEVLRQRRHEERQRALQSICVDCKTVFVKRTNFAHQVRCSSCAYKITIPRYRHIRRATAIVHAAVKSGRLPNPKTLTCADCSGAATEYDHRDYSQPLTVEPVCHSCNVRRGPGARQAA